MAQIASIPDSIARYVISVLPPWSPDPHCDSHVMLLTGSMSHLRSQAPHTLEGGSSKRMSLNCVTLDAPATFSKCMLCPNFHVAEESHERAALTYKGWYKSAKTSGAAAKRSGPILDSLIAFHGFIPAKSIFKSLTAGTSLHSLKNLQLSRTAFPKPTCSCWTKRDHVPAIPRYALVK